MNEVTLSAQLFVFNKITLHQQNCYVNTWVTELDNRKYN